MSIPYKIEENLLTTPTSHSVRFVPRASAGREEIAADIALRHPNFSKKDILTLLDTEDEVIALRLLNGEQVTKERCCTWFPSFAARLENPDDPLPPLDQCLNLNVRVSAPFIEEFRQNAEVERLPSTEKVPVITAAEDMLLDLRDVLNPDGMLHITGSNLAIDRQDSATHCLIEGTRNGSAIQSRVGSASNSEIILMPDVPDQVDPWNNEYRLSVTTRYTEHGSLRTGIYGRMLRTPLAVNGFGEFTGILTGSADAPYVTITGGSVSADTRLRIQVIREAVSNRLKFSLLDINKGGAAGNEVSMMDSADVNLTLPGFAGSPVTSLTITVQNYAALLDLVRNEYSGRLIDILDITTA